MRQFDGERRQLLVAARAIFGGNEIARHQHRPKSPGVAATHIAGHEPVRGRQKPRDRAMFTMGTHGADNRGGADQHAGDVARVPARVEG